MPKSRTATSSDTVGSILRLANILTRDMAPVFEKAKVTPQQWMLLMTLKSIDGVPTLAGLARHMMVSKQNVTGMVRRLEDAGFVNKTDDPEDLRSSRVALTRRGRELLSRLAPQYRRWVDEFFDQIEADDREAFERALGALVERSG